MNRRKLTFLLPMTLLVFLSLQASTSAAQTPPLLGVCTVEQLSEAPHGEWFAPGYAEYVPDPDLVEALQDVDLEDVRVDIFFGTWCGDSRRETPRMLKLLDAAGLDASARRLIAVDRKDELHKRSPGGEEEGFEIYRVPTLVVLRGDREIGRIVEYPALSLERDLLAILEEKPYEPSYASFPVVRRWLRDGLLADPNVSADGLADQVRSLVSSEWEIYSAARVLASRGDVQEALKLAEVQRSLYWDNALSHARLADLQIRTGRIDQARVSAKRAVARNDDPDRAEDLVELIERIGRADAAGGDDSPDLATLENELRAAETAFAAAFAAGDMEAFAEWIADDAVFFTGGDRHLRGKEAIAASWRRMRERNAETPFTWGPERIAVEMSGSYGLSTGRVLSPEGEWTSTFISTWKHTPEGWRVLLDVGARCPPEK